MLTPVPYNKSHKDAAHAPVRSFRWDQLADYRQPQHEARGCQWSELNAAA